VTCDTAWPTTLDAKGIRLHVNERTSALWGPSPLGASSAGLAGSAPPEVATAARSVASSHGDQSPKVGTAAVAALAPASQKWQSCHSSACQMASSQGDQ